MWRRKAKIKRDRLIRLSDRNDLKKAGRSVIGRQHPAQVKRWIDSFAGLECHLCHATILITVAHRNNHRRSSPRRIATIDHALNDKIERVTPVFRPRREAITEVDHKWCEHSLIRHEIVGPQHDLTQGGDKIRPKGRPGRVLRHLGRQRYTKQAEPIQ